MSEGHTGVIDEDARNDKRFATYVDSCVALWRYGSAQRNLKQTVRDVVSLPLM